MKFLLLICLLAVFSALPCFSELINHKSHDVNVKNLKDIDFTASTAVLTQPGILAIIVLLLSHTPTHFNQYSLYAIK